MNVIDNMTCYKNRLNRKTMSIFDCFLLLGLSYLFCCWCVGITVNADTDQLIVNKSFPITTLINAKWEQTPLYLEIAEYLADENSNLFWDFVHDVTVLPTKLNEHKTESQRYNTALDLVRKRLSELQMPFMKLVISTHSLTARIQTHLQIANEFLSVNSSCLGAEVFVQIGDIVVCHLNDFKALINHNHNKCIYETLNKTETYSFDHIYPGSENHDCTLIVYGDMGTKIFAQYHQLLTELVSLQHIRYILRHFVLPENLSGKRVRLSGYGVELHLKSTEYKSQDDSPKQGNDTTVDENDNRSNSSTQVEMELQGFDFAILKQRFSMLAHSLDKFRQSLQQSNDEIAQLKAWEFQDLGLQATAAIASIQGEEALQILQFLAHNFPMQAKTLLSHKVTDELRLEVSHNMDIFARTLNIIAPDGALFINGLFFDADATDLNTLIDTLRSEVRVLEQLYNSRIQGAMANSLLALDFTGAGLREFAIDIRDTAINWINDIENDAQYRRWPSSVTDLLRPTFPGMLHNIRKNVFNLVLVVDPLNPSSRSIIKLVESFVIHMAPVRVGIVFDGRNANETTREFLHYLSMVCAFNYVHQKRDGRAALSFLTDVFTNVDDNQPVERQHIRSQLRKTFDTLYGRMLDDVLSEDSDYDYGRQLSKDFVERLGFASTPQALMNGVPIPTHLLSSNNEFEEAIFSDIIQKMAILQKAVLNGDLTDSHDIMDYLMNQPHVMPRLNQRILNDNEVTDDRILDFTGNPHLDLNNVKALAQLSNRDMTATLINNLKYFEIKHSSQKIGSSQLHFLTLWIIADAEDSDGKILLANALRYLKTGAASVRLAFLPNTEDKELYRKTNLNRLIWAAMQTLPSTSSIDFTLKWITHPPSNINDIPNELHDILSSTEIHVKMLRVFVQRVFGLKPAQRMVISNGKHIGPLNSDEDFTIDDFGLIDRLNSIQYGDKMRKLFQVMVDEVENSHIDSDTLLRLYGCLVPRQTKTRFRIPDNVKDEYSVIKLMPRNDSLPHFDVVAVVDPASRSAQKLAPIVNLLRNTLNSNIRVYLTPIHQHSDMPVTSFYRYVVEPEVQFLPNGALADGPIAKFTGVPANPLLTQNLHVPENWLVEAVRSVYDLDNIRLNEIGGPVHSEYELEYILLEGHCFDSVSGAPPRGLQITLGTHDNPVVVDTIVMANLGYFQLKANPGVWRLRLRDGKSADIYDITYAEGPNTVHENDTTQVVITSLRSHVIKLRVSKKVGKQNADLLGDDDPQTQSGIWNSIASSFGGGGDASDSNGSNDSETINIFSVASGHLYERLLRIMMLSLLKYTKSPVKFWFLKNYLSPQFTDFLPHMAREYGFHYELVQYKWPRWLHQQTEKQRTIWGYKILFLDVLFPLNVRKIIFVDADAIVRADLKELYNMDLGGAPYAYTPFCDSRKEMEGFRFWKQGYWRNHLMGRRYHISALYVVDLKHFRKIAAGDRLRGQYQALSQDPNSLSNLDQDLPNNMIHQVAIKSLPDEWLWCQTWCSDTAFSKAKVIDLCNNPQTKEAKLTAAQRIVPEWKDYDAEIKQLMARIEDHENTDHIDENITPTTITSTTINYDIPMEHESKHSEL